MKDIGATIKLKWFIVFSMAWLLLQVIFLAKSNSYTEDVGVSIRLNDSLKNVITQRDKTIADYKNLIARQKSYNSSVFGVCIQNGLYGESTIQFFNSGIDTYEQIGLEGALQLDNKVTIRTDYNYRIGERLRLVSDNY